MAAIISNSFSSLLAISSITPIHTLQVGSSSISGLGATEHRAVRWPASFAHQRVPAA
jgi:hypothetical protein